MFQRILVAITILVIASCSTIPRNGSYESGLAIWNSVKDRSGFSAYMSAFIGFNNQNHLDERDNCYQRLQAPTDLILEIAADGRITQASTSTNDSGCECFRKAYQGVIAPVPPMTPFAIKMTMGSRSGA